MRAFGMIRTAAIVFVAVMAGTSGCATASSAPRACTLVGCEAGLSIDIRGDRGGDISVKLVAADGQMRSFECDGEARDCSAFFADYSPENVTVTVMKKESNIVRSVPVSYRNTYPNGEACPPVCRQGHIDFTV
jgi:hypothetical protein